MKHAILIMTYNNEEITRRFLKLYDNDNIDFYIHVDKKAKYFRYDLLKGVCEKSKVIFVDQIKVYWGTVSQIQAEYVLLENAKKNNYDYYHLISSADIPLYSCQEFLDFFNKYSHYEFVEYSPEYLIEQYGILDRVKYYHFFGKGVREKNILLRKVQSLVRSVMLDLQVKLKVNRIEGRENTLKYGSQWFHITNEFAKYVLKDKKQQLKKYRLTSCCDEIFLQTLLVDSPYFENNYYNKSEEEQQIKMNRYVDWNRGQPYTFVEKDFEEIIKIKQALFVRKFDYELCPSIVNQMFGYLESFGKNKA